MHLINFNGPDPSHWGPLPTPVDTGAPVQLSPRLSVPDLCWVLMFGAAPATPVPRYGPGWLTDWLTGFPAQPWTCCTTADGSGISGLCLTLVTLTGPDPNLWTDSPAFPRTCLFTMTCLIIYDLCWIGCCLEAGSWLVGPLPCCLPLTYAGHCSPCRASFGASHAVLAGWVLSPDVCFSSGKIYLICLFL